MVVQACAWGVAGGRAMDSRSHQHHRHHTQGSFHTKRNRSVSRRSRCSRRDDSDGSGRTDPRHCTTSPSNARRSARSNSDSQWTDAPPVMHTSNSPSPAQPPKMHRTSTLSEEAPAIHKRGYTHAHTRLLTHPLWLALLVLVCFLGWCAPAQAITKLTGACVRVMCCI